MNYEAKQLYPLYENLLQQKPLNNGTKELLFAVAAFDMNKVTGTVDFKARKSNRDYLAKELKWYKSMKLTPPKGITIWDQIKGTDGKVNSNYGYLVYGQKNGSQFYNALKALSADKETRQAMIIYTRPSMHKDWNCNSKHDFVCTIYQQFFIRKDRLHCITNMRSNDCIFGTFNDIPWFEHVYNEMYGFLLQKYPSLKKGTLTFAANSFHCYSRHFDTLEKIVKQR